MIELEVEMATTTLLKRQNLMHRGPLPACHDGAGVLDFTVVLGDDDLKGRHLKFIHDDVLAPGVSIGVHTHTDDEETYYILEGEGTMTLDNETFAVRAGDIAAVFPGGRHGLANTSDADLRIIVVCTA
jgi:uncharacterized cupin superfamily protein